MGRLSRMLRTAVWTGIAVNSVSLLAGPLDEPKVRTAVLQRFDENRNDKLEPLEARQSRTRLKNLLDDTSTREINIFTWRDDLKEVLQSLDQDGDNRLSAEERDVGVAFLEKFIPKVDTSNPVKEKEKEKNSERSRPNLAGASTSSATRDRNRGNRGNGNGYSTGVRYGMGGMGGGGFGMGYSGNNWGNSYSGSGNTLSTGGGGSGNAGGTRRGFSGTDGLYEPLSAGNGVPASGLANPAGQTAVNTRERPQKPNSGARGDSGFGRQLEPLADTQLPNGTPSGGNSDPGGSPRPNSATGKPGSPGSPPDGLGGHGDGLTPPADVSPSGTKPKPGGSGGPTLTPPIPKPNF